MLRTRLVLNEQELYKKLPFLHNGQRRTKAQLAGIRYEHHAQDYLTGIYGERYVPGPWISWLDTSGRERFCQPDGLLFDFMAGRITIIEIKLKHTADAWKQIKRKYEPRVREIFPSPLWTISACEVVHWYDPHTYFPEDVYMVKSIEALATGRFGVHVFANRPRAFRPRKD